MNEGVVFCIMFFIRYCLDLPMLLFIPFQTNEKLIKAIFAFALITLCLNFIFLIMFCCKIYVSPILIPFIVTIWILSLCSLKNINKMITFYDSSDNSYSGLKTSIIIVIVISSCEILLFIIEIFFILYMKLEEKKGKFLRIIMIISMHIQLMK